MSKLPKENRFVDLSDFGRPAAVLIARSLQYTAFTPVHVTIGFIISGLLAILCMYHQYYVATGFFLILKSVLDAADGELARIKNKPSYTGRYLDSVSDIILNFLFLLTIWHITEGSLFYTLLAFAGLQLQGTLYNYYYVILRNQNNGDTTSRIFEDKVPLALKGEKQRNVNILFSMYKFCYGIFDKIIYWLDRKAPKGENLPNCFMTAVSTFGLGFQLLIISVMLVLDLPHYIVPFFICYSIFILLFIGIRRMINP